MMLVEQTTVPNSALPVAEFKDHLRLGTGFADDGLQDDIVTRALRAAISAIEARTGKALLARDFKWNLSGFRSRQAVVLPIAPVSGIASFKVIDRLGTEYVIDPAAYGLAKDLHGPRLVAASLALPTIPTAGTAEIEFTAGFGPLWSDIPADLAQAVFLLAAHYYERREEMHAGSGQMPFGIASLLERYRNLRVFGGSGQ